MLRVWEAIAPSAFNADASTPLSKAEAIVCGAVSRILPT